MGLVVRKSREIEAQFCIEENNETIIVKETRITVNPDGVSFVYETMKDAEMYAKYRKDMRKQEQELRTLRYQIEDEVLAEMESETKE